MVTDTIIANCVAAFVPAGFGTSDAHVSVESVACACGGGLARVYVNIPEEPDTIGKDSVPDDVNWVVALAEQLEPLGLATAGIELLAPPKQPASDPPSQQVNAKTRRINRLPTPL